MNKKMKIFLVGNSDIVLIKFRKEFIRKLSRKYDVYLVFPFGKFTPELKALRIRLINTPRIIRRKFLFLEALKLLLFYSSIILKHKPTYIFSYTIKPNVFIGLTRFFLKFIFIPTITGLGSSLQGKNLRSIFMKNLYKVSLKFSKFIVFQNETDKEILYSNRKHHKFRIFNGSGVNIKEYYYSKNIKTFDEIKVLFIGRIMKEKGIEKYLDLVQYNFNNNHLSFYLCGDYEETHYKNRINSLVSQRKLTFFKYLKDPRPVYKLCNILVNPSYHEGLSNTILEGMAMGLIPLGSNISGIKQIITHSKDGFLFNVNDSNDLFNQFRRILNYDKNDLYSISVNARKKVERKFNRRTIVNNYIELISH